MYNEKIKNEYLQTLYDNAPLANVNTFLSRVSEIEEILDKDLGKFTFEEYVFGLENLGFYTYFSLRNFMSSATVYLRWYSETIEKVNQKIINLSPLDIDLSKGLKKNLINDITDIEDINSIRPFSKGYIEMPVLCLIWMGLSIEEIIDLDIDCLEKEDKDIYIISNKGRYLVSSVYIQRILINYQQIRQVQRNLDDDFLYATNPNKFIRSFKKVDSVYKSGITKKKIFNDIHHCSLMRIDKGLNPIKSSSVELSGKLWRMRETERSGKILTDKDYMDLCSSRIDYYVADGKKLYATYKEVFGA